MNPLTTTKLPFGKVIAFSPNQKPKERSKGKIAIVEGSNIQLIEFDQISHLQSDSNYTKIRLSNGVNILSCKTLKRFEDRVDESQFLRIHKSYIINVEQIARFDTSLNRVDMKDGSHVPVSRARKSILMQYLKNLMV